MILSSTLSEDEQAKLDHHIQACERAMDHLNHGRKDEFSVAINDLSLIARDAGLKVYRERLVEIGRDASQCRLLEIALMGLRHDQIISDRSFRHLRESYRSRAETLRLISRRK